MGGRPKHVFFYGKFFKNIFKKINIMKHIDESIIGKKFRSAIENKYDLKEGDVVVFRNGNIGVVGAYLDYYDGPEQFVNYMSDGKYNFKTLIGKYASYEEDMTCPDEAYRKMDIMEVYRDPSGKVVKELQMADNTAKAEDFLNDLTKTKKYKRFLRIYWREYYN
jgi:hypothetical protein